MSAGLLEFGQADGGLARVAGDRHTGRRETVVRADGLLDLLLRTGRVAERTGGTDGDHPRGIGDSASRAAPAATSVGRISDGNHPSPARAARRSATADALPIQ